MWYDFSQSACITAPTPVQENFPERLAKNLLVEANMAYTCTPTAEGYLLTPKQGLTGTKNSYMPKVSISVSQKDTQTTLKLEGRPLDFVLIFSWVFILGCILLEFFCLFVLSVTGFEDVFPIFIPFILMVFAYLLASLGTKFSFRTVVKTIERMWQSQ